VPKRPVFFSVAEWGGSVSGRGAKHHSPTQGDSHRVDAAPATRRRARRRRRASTRRSPHLPALPSSEDPAQERGCERQLVPTAAAGDSHVDRVASAECIVSLELARQTRLGVGWREAGFRRVEGNDRIRELVPVHVAPHHTTPARACASGPESQAVDHEIAGRNRITTQHCDGNWHLARQVDPVVRAGGLDVDQHVAPDPLGIVVCARSATPPPHRRTRRRNCH
jgi:hypothetical protein